MHVVKFNFCFLNPLTTIVPHLIETSQLICIANQLTGFFMMWKIGRSWIKRLIGKDDRQTSLVKLSCENDQQIVTVNYFHKTLHLRCLTVFWIRLWKLLYFQWCILRNTFLVCNTKKETIYKSKEDKSIRKKVIKEFGEKMRTAEELFWLWFFWRKLISVFWELNF